MLIMKKKKKIRLNRFYLFNRSAKCFFLSFPFLLFFNFFFISHSRLFVQISDICFSYERSYCIFVLRLSQNSVSFNSGVSQCNFIEPKINIRCAGASLKMPGEGYAMRKSLIIMDAGASIYIFVVYTCTKELGVIINVFP